MNKNDLAAYVATSIGLPKMAAFKAVDAILSGIAETLKKGEDVTVVGFGSFNVVERAARTGRNPRNGTAVAIPASRKAKFKPEKPLRDAVNGVVPAQGDLFRA